ncbi:MAG: hypothetical protein GY756_16950 [bacterium]|nr:hypothetical protein [bacterium]
MKGIIIYKSKYGTTRQYAQWIEEETKFECISLKKLKMKKLLDSDVIVIGCSIMAGHPSLSKWIKRNWSKLNNKKIYLFSTSGAHSSDPSLNKGFEASLPKEISSKISYYPLSGKMVFDTLSGIDKMFMKIGQKIEKDPIVKEKMLEDTDKIKRDEILPLVSAVNQH